MSKTEYLTKFVDYIRNTGRRPLAVEIFDEDWEPIGPRVRADLVREGMIEAKEDGIWLKEEVGVRWVK